MMQASTKIAVAQLASSASADENLAKAVEVIKQVAALGTKLVVFPEIFMALLVKENFNPEYARGVSQTLDGSFVVGLQKAAREHGIWVVSGMLETAVETQDKTYNSTVVIDDQGALVGVYRKTHLYDAFGFQESPVFARGEQLFEPIETPLGRMGLFVCYELRFPEIARQQAVQGVDFFIMPSAWVVGPMKEYQWRHMVVSRAIENTAYMVTCDQVGHIYMGRSLIVDPMGVVLAEGTEEEDVMYAELSLPRVQRVRAVVPSLTHRRRELYR